MAWTIASTEVLASQVEHVTFHNEENGFSALWVKARGQRDLVTVPGDAATTSAGEFVQVSSAWVDTRALVQFKAKKCCQSKGSCNLRCLVTPMPPGPDIVTARPVDVSTGAQGRLRQPR